MKNNFNMKNADHNLRISNFFTQRRSQDTLRHLRWISLQQYLKAKNCQLLLKKLFISGVFEDHDTPL